MPTMRDVARLADVSIATVSFVINETKPVSAATRQRVEDAMRELGYRRNALGRALASKRTRIIALLYPALQRRLHESAVEFFTSAAQAARDLGHSLVLWPASNDADQVQEIIANGLIDGVLLMEVQMDDPRVEQLVGSTMPFSLIGRTRHPEQLPYVDVDFENSLIDAIGYLEGLGHRKICLLDNGSAELALAGYGPLVRARETFAAEMARRGLEPVRLSCQDSPISGEGAAEELLATAPDATAVVLMNDSAVFGFVSGLRRHGVRIPEDLSVVLFASTPDVAASTDPHLTLWRLPGVELGRRGVESLVDQLEGRGEPMTQGVVKCTFEEGASTAAPHIPR